MSPETLTIVISAIGIVLTLGTSMFGGLTWVIYRMDARIDGVTGRIDSVEERLTARIDGVEEKLTARIDTVGADVTDLKIAVARLEGPPRHLVMTGR